jgi:dTDP-4-dehydrorhamnose reductase
MKKILILGSGGMAGSAIYKYLTSLNKYEIYDIVRDRINDSTIVLDVKEDWSLLEANITWIHPNVIINCIGILVKDSETNPANAIYLNSYFPHWLENITKDTNTKIIHLSTDCVFKGDKENGGYSDKDIPDGVGFYSRSKALGEIINKKDLTIRMSIIGSELKGTGSGLFSWFLRQKGTVNGYSEAFWGGGTTLWLAQNIDKMINSEITGLYQLAPEYKISKYDLLELIKVIWNRLDITLFPNNNLKQDKTLINSNRENFIPYNPIDYKSMLLEYKQWIDKND